jgi:hypothetical protein
MDNGVLLPFMGKRTFFLTCRNRLNHDGAAGANGGQKLKSNHLLARRTMRETMAAEKQDACSRSVGKQQ